LLLAGSLARGQPPTPGADDQLPGQLLPDPHDDGPSLRSDAKIVGGEPAGRGAWPWQVAVYRRVMRNGKQRDFLFCGGSLIDPRWVLTAAHCLGSDRADDLGSATADDMLVVEGTNTVTPSKFGGGNPSGRRLRVKRILIHEQWDPRSRENDIALLELAAPAASKPISVLTRPRVSDAIPPDGLESEGVFATVTGWGHLGFNDPKVPTSLMQVEVPLVSLSACQRAYGGRGGLIDERTICAGESTGGKDACTGDSGGPLVVRKPDGEYVQVGIVSWGQGCGLADFFGVYTRVSAFINWMQKGTALAALGEAPTVSPSTPPAARSPINARPEPAFARGDRALLVGIDRYENSRLNLKGAGNDVRNMQRLLTQTFGFSPHQIKSLLDAQATRENVLHAFDDWLIDGSVPGARIFLFISSHGAQVPDVNGDEEDGLDEAIAPHDTRVEVQNGKKVLRNLIIDDEIDERLKRIPDRKVTVVIDSCHSGAATRDADIGIAPAMAKCLCAVLDDYDPQALTIDGERGRSTRSAGPKHGFIERHDNVVAWSAVNDGQLALVDTESGGAQGVFTRRFIEGITRGVAGLDRMISHAGLLDYVRAQSEAYCARHRKDCPAGLSPQLESRAELLPLDVVTGRPPSRPQDVPHHALVHDNSAGITVDIVQGTRLRIGQLAQFRVTTRQPGYLVLLDVSPEGKVTQIFPNERSLTTSTGSRKGSNLVTPAHPLLVPDAGNPYSGFEYQIDPPQGDGRLIAIVSKDPIRAIRVPPQPTTLDVDSGTALVAQIADELLREPVIAGKVRKREWSVAQTSYRIIP
jgi:hypothetical protein